MEEKWKRLIERHRHILVERQDNFALFFGGRGHINLASEGACGALMLQPGRQTLIANNIEIDRLLQEEAVAREQLEIRSFPWYEEHLRTEIVRELTGGEPYVTDRQIQEELVELRTGLSSAQLAVVRDLGRTTALGLEAVCRQIRRGMTEYEAAGLVANAFVAQGIDPIVNLVGSDGRLERYRHFLPTGRAIEKYAVLSVVTRYRGLAVSATRSVHFGAMDEDVKRKQEAVRRIDALLTAHTVPGQTFAGLFERLVQWYAEAGYPNEWRNHHQGGLAGYLPREERLLPQSTRTIRACQMVAWNPSLPGAKSEDTLLTAEAGPEIVTWTGDFPYEDIRVNGRTIRKSACLIR